MKSFYDKITDFFNTPSKVMTLALLTGIITTLFLLFVPVFYRDSVVYMAMVNGIYFKNWELGFALPITPLLPALATLLLPLGFDTQQATMLISSIFCVLTIFPLYGMLSFITERKYAAWGALLFIITPNIIRVGMAPLLDSGRWFFFSLAFYFIFSFVKKQKIGKLFLLGLSFAGLSLVRSEGIVYVCLLSAAFFFMLWQHDKWPFALKKIGRYILFILLSLSFMSIFLIPRMIQVYNATGYPALDTRQTWAIRGIWHHITKTCGVKEEVKSTKTLASAVSNYGSINDFNFDWFFQSKFNERFWHNIVRGCYELYGIIAVLGLIMLLFRRQWRFEHSLFITFFIVNGLIFFLMRSAALRYFFINVILLLPFTLEGLKYVIEKLGSLKIKSFEFKYLLPLIFCAVFFAQVARGMKNFFDINQNYYPELASDTREMRSHIKTRSNTKKPTLLVIGDNYGWGFHLDCNVIFYGPANHIEDNYTFEQIINSGVPSRLAYYSVENLDNISLLYPDLVIVSDCDKLEEIKKRFNANSRLQMLQYDNFKNGIVWKVNAKSK